MVNGGVGALREAPLTGLETCMDIILHNIRIPLEKDGIAAYKELAAGKLSLSASDILSVRLLKKSLDARRKGQFFFNISLIASVKDNYENKKGFPLYSPLSEKTSKTKDLQDAPLIVGMGPCGIFAAMAFLKHGIKPVIFERGKKVEDRHKDISAFIEERSLNTESNIHFGEGGAGTYSDGKLVTRVKDTPAIRTVMDTFVRFGAPEEIQYLNKPHIGTDVLRKILVNMREFIIDNGGTIHYETKITDVIIEDDEIKGVTTSKGDTFSSSTIIFAIGNSARDTFKMLHEKNISMEQKAFAIGPRIEHPADVINLMQYGKKYKDHPSLGPAEYAFTYNNKKTGRGVFSFCMCPGGEIVNSSTEENMAAVNGMSSSTRSGQFSNSAIVVTVRPQDLGSDHPLAGIEFQRDIERKAFECGGGSWAAPAQNLKDFLKNKRSTEVKATSFLSGITPAELKEVFPDIIHTELLNAFTYWQEKLPLFVCDEAVLIGAETRTSSPVRILRKETGESEKVNGLYPAGEGSGYSGGITSSAIDGIRVVERILEA